MQKNELSFIDELTAIINRHSMENASNTPDFILAQFMGDSLRAFNKATETRSQWYGHHEMEGKILNCEVPGLPNMTVNPNR